MEKSNIHVLTGINALLNTENIKPGINLKQLEKQMVSEGLIKPVVTKPNDTFNEELSSAASKLGISLDDILDEPKKPEPVEPDESPSPVEECNFTDVKIDKPFNNVQGNTLEYYTKEQQRREQINNVMKMTSNVSKISFEEEKKEDLKCEMLAEIDALMEDLDIEENNLANIPKVDKNSSYSEVENTLKRLRYKNDHAQYCHFANELLLLLAHAMGTLFDGKKVWFGKYRPDLTGWHNIVLQKTKRMRYNTGQIVYKFMQEYKISPFLRILFELIPNMLIYSNTKSRGYGQDLYNDEFMSNIQKQY